MTLTSVTKTVTSAILPAANHEENQGEAEMNSKHGIFLITVVALMLTLAGCTTHYVHQRHEAEFLPDPVDLKTPAACYVVLTQDDPFIATKSTASKLMPYTFANNGLVGLILTYVMNQGIKTENDVANEIRKQTTGTRSAPLRGHGLGALFANDFQSSLSTSLTSSPWLHPMPLEMIRERRPLTVAELNKHPVLEIHMMYQLSYDASALLVQAHMAYFKQGQTNADHFRFYTYFSEPVGPEKDEAAVAKWVASDDELLRRRMREGIDEIVAMLNVDFLRPKWRDPSIPNTTISCYDALNQQHMKWEGHVLRQKSPRIIFQEKGGNLFSVIPN